MWLLSTDRAELHYFQRNFDAIGGYAILSHTWYGNEHTLQQVRAIVGRCRANGTNPRDDPVLSPKIRECCILAEKHGYRWVWIDSCCIDKTSSSELSEAINSMYQWYSEAEVCYAYLADVPDDCVLDEPDSAFRRSRWHTRGWTLQELIAPSFVIFLSTNWQEIGNRVTLARLLFEITRIPTKVLTREADHTHYSISIRMYWASRRKTTRVEDEAYSLMGLFRVSMPTNYGEGSKAFIRLQYEIMRNNPDTSLFAFGDAVRCWDLKTRDVTLDPKIKIGDPLQFLLADSPRLMRVPFTYTPDLDSHAKQEYPPPLDAQTSDGSTIIGPFDAIELPRVMVTSYGVELRLPIIETDGVTIAVLLCETRRGHFGLFLQQDPQGKDPTRPRYHVGCVYFTHSESRATEYMARLANLGDDLYNLRFDGRRVAAHWRTIYVVPMPPDWDARSAVASSLAVNARPAPPFRFPHWLLARLTTLEFVAYENVFPKDLTAIKFFHSEQDHIHLVFGLCHEHDRAPESESKSESAERPAAADLNSGSGLQRVHWAKVVISLFPPKLTHNCAEDHVASWTASSRDFGDAEKTVRLSLMPCAWMPATTLVIHMELLGRVYNEILRESNVSFPSLAELVRQTSRPATVAAQLEPRPSESLRVEVRVSRSSSSGSMVGVRTSPSRIPRPASSSRLEESRVEGGIL